MKTIPIILFIGSLLLACSKEGGDEDVFDRIDLVRVITPDFLNGKEPYYFIDKYRISGKVLPPFNRFSIDLNVYYPSVKEEYDEEFKWCFFIDDMGSKVYVHSSTCLNYDLHRDDLDVFKFIEKAFDSFEKKMRGDPKAKFIEDKFLYDNQEYELKSLDIEIGATFFTKENKDDNETLYIVFFFENPNQTEYLQIFFTYGNNGEDFELENILLLIDQTT